VQLPKRLVDTHKGTYGHVFIVGGSLGLTGAVCLCAQASLKIGAGLVTVGVPRSLNDVFEIKLTEEMSLPLPDKNGYLSTSAFKEIHTFSGKASVIVLGPGAGHKNHTQKLIAKIIKSNNKPLVVDADGINALALYPHVLDKRKTKDIVLTPHLGEFSRLIKLDKEKIKTQRKSLVKETALRYNLNLVLKGNHSLVSDGRELFENSTGNPGMATAGMGDVLTGIVAGLIAQGLSCFEAAKLGVYLHGLAGDLAAEDKTQNCLIASDVIEYLPKAIKVSCA